MWAFSLSNAGAGSFVDFFSSKGKNLLTLELCLYLFDITKYALLLCLALQGVATEEIALWWLEAFYAPNSIFYWSHSGPFTKKNDFAELS